MTGEVWILGRGPADWEATQLVERSRERGISAIYVDGDLLRVHSGGYLSGQTSVSEPQVVVVRSQFFTGVSADARADLYALLFHLEQMGTVVRSCASSIVLANQKPLAARRLRAAGLPTPAFVEVKSVEELRHAARQWDRLVLKPVTGQASIDVLALGILDRDRTGELNEREMIHVAHHFRRHPTLCAQELVSPAERYTGYGRILMVGTTAIAAYHIQTTSGLSGWPGQAVSVLERRVAGFGPEVLDLARRAQDVLGLETSSVDLAFDDDSTPTIVEVNPLVSVWESLGNFRLCEEDVADLHIDCLIEPWLNSGAPTAGVAHG